MHYSRLWAEDRISILDLNESEFLQEISNSSPNDPENIQDDKIISVAFSDNSTCLFVAAPYNFKIFEYENGEWVLERHEPLPFEYSCFQGVFVRGSNDSIIAIMGDILTDISETHLLHAVKFTMKRDEDLTSENYPIEQILLLYPKGPPFKRHVLDRSGSPRTSACYELLSNEKVNTVFSTDCSLIAAICYGDIYLFQRGSTRQKTGEFPYAPKIKFNMSSLEYFSNMFFNPTTDAFFVDVGGKVQVFEILNSKNGLECISECSICNPCESNLYCMTDKRLIFLEQDFNECRGFMIDCITTQQMKEDRDALRKQIGITFAGLPSIKGDILLNIVHPMIYEYGYDDNLWPLIQGWIEHEFSEFFQNP